MLELAPVYPIWAYMSFSCIIIHAGGAFNQPIISTDGWLSNSINKSFRSSDHLENLRIDIDIATQTIVYIRLHGKDLNMATTTVYLRPLTTGYFFVNSPKHEVVRHKPDLGWVLERREVL